MLYLLYFGYGYLIGAEQKVLKVGVHSSSLVGFLQD